MATRPAFFNNHPIGSFSSIVAGLLCLTFATQSASAAAAHQPGASVYVDAGSQSASDGGWGDLDAGLTLATFYGEGVASANFYGPSPLASASADSSRFIPGYARAIAGIDDWLTFSNTPNNWYTDVTIHVSGNWHISYTPGVDNHGSSPSVRFSVGLTRDGAFSNTFDSWRSLSDGSVQSSKSYEDTVVTGSWAGILLPNGTSASGSYAYAFTTRVYEGWLYHLGLAVIAEAPSGAKAFIDDPLVLDLPPGVTFTSASLSPYTKPVPLPATGMLLGAGVLGCAGMRKTLRARRVQSSNPGNRGA